MGKPSRLSAEIDGEPINAFTLGADGSLSARFQTQKSGGMIDIKLKVAVENPQSPKAMGLSEDERTLIYFLKSINLTEV